MTRKVILGISISALFIFAAGCAGQLGTKKGISAKPVGMEGLATKEQQAAALAGKMIPATKLQGRVRELATMEEKQVFKTIHFDFDQSSIRPDARIVLENIAVYLKSKRKVKVSFEGHCDERGTSEYNMALGERRSLSARRYLVSLGIAPERLGTVSYGAEKPFDSGHDEIAWAKNRRCEFKIVE
ncbi:MAG: peptidoglycan-associated lipoprotein Pal [Candidatus Ratteibacteria bacterium]